MLCRWGHHRVDPAAAWNGGIGFSRCLLCSAELVQRPGARWARVPRGYAVIWRPAAERPALAPRKDARPSLIGRLSRRLRDHLHMPVEQPSRRYRYLARRIGKARTILLSALCNADSANDALLLLAAMVQQEQGGRVLLIDATLANDGVSALLVGRGHAGLSEVRAEDPWSAVEAMRLLARPDMILLGAGRNPAAGRPEHIAAMLPFLTERFDHILIQQRGIGSDSRNLTLARAADLVWTLAEEGRSPMARLHDARDAFRAHGIAPAGLILTVPAHGG
ncbi:hypothetical protein ASE85_20965 [Sphingobium sp. Leaf26]|uniref:hypothetical protein n=1 Tax=Sphingobium sp. Leaf26 TaxID=1735693 RepID=UPI0006FBF82F|nr:hypothetical protein [Sphingobium sp. Leaf26]KQN04207.1 hypothetical protein ASE85_20965 [Sphingobium sp. Leaf26]